MNNFKKIFMSGGKLNISSVLPFDCAKNFVNNNKKSVYFAPDDTLPQYKVLYILHCIIKNWQVCFFMYRGDGIDVLPNDYFRDNGFNQFCSFRLTTTTGNSLNFVLTYQPSSSRQENTIELCYLLRGF
jgi:hypothetical protein